MQPKQIIELYCMEYGLKPEALKMNGKTVKWIDGVHTDWIRLCLAYYLRVEYKLGHSYICELIGYKNHSSSIYALRKMRVYLALSDELIAPYWNKLIDITTKKAA